MSEYQVPDKTFPITAELRRWAQEVEQAIDYLTTSSGDPAHKIRPITIPLNDGKGGKFEEQCGLAFGDKGNNGQEATFMVGTHTNELTALRLVNIIKDYYLSHEKSMRGKQINLIFGGDPARAKELLATLQDPNITQMTEDQYELCRNTAHGINCNRVDMSRVPRPAPDDTQETANWEKAFNRLRYGLPLERTSMEGEKKWYEQLKSHYDSLESAHGTAGWLAQKHFFLQRYKDRIDFHTTSRTGTAFAVKYQMQGQEPDEAMFRLMARMGATTIDISPDEGNYIHLCNSLNMKEKDGILFECGAHRELEQSGKRAENALYGAIADKLGIFMTEESKASRSVTMNLCGDTLLIFPPFSPTLSHMKNGAVNPVPEFYLKEKRISANDPRIEQGHWGNDASEKESLFRAISSDDPLPQSLKDILRNETISTHHNGSKVHKNAPLYWTTYSLSDGTIIPVIFRSPVDGVVFMTPAKGWDKMDGKFSFTELCAGQKEVTVDLKKQETGLSSLLKHVSSGGRGT